MNSLTDSVKRLKVDVISHSHSPIRNFNSESEASNRKMLSNRLINQHRSLEPRVSLSPERHSHNSNIQFSGKNKTYFISESKSPRNNRLSVNIVGNDSVNSNRNNDSTLIIINKSN